MKESAVQSLHLVMFSDTRL